MFGIPGGVEWMVIGVIALLIFGKRLPEVMRSVGKGITEFKHGMRDVTDEVTNLTDIEATPRPIDAPQHDGDDDMDLDEAFGDEGDYEEDDYEEDDEQEVEESDEEEGAAEPAASDETPAEADTADGRDLLS